MKPGRPKLHSHIKSYWVSVDSDDGTIFYELNSKGNLVKLSDGSIQPHHIVSKTGAVLGPMHDEGQETQAVPVITENYPLLIPEEISALLTMDDIFSTDMVDNLTLL